MQDEHNVREVLEGAFVAIHGWRKREKSPGYWEHHPLWFRFRRFLAAEAYLDAAMMLIPSEHWGYQIMPFFCVLRHPEKREGDVEAHGTHPAIALATAALKAKEMP